MRGDDIGNEFASDFERLDRPFEPASAPELSRMSDIPEWKQPDMDNRMQYWEEEHPFATTGFEAPRHLNDADWW